jgi:drug/metabolite transporter (DMT)-like permease
LSPAPLLPAINQLKGIAALVSAGAILSLTDSLAKLLTGTYPVGEILFFRSLFVFIPVFFMVYLTGGLGSLRINNWKGQILRGCCVLFTTVGFVTAIKVMPLADVIAIFFVSPIFGTAMAPFLLGENVGWRRWTAVLIGFAGVMFMIQPGSNPLVWIAVFALAAAFTNSLRDILTRRLSTTETNNSIMFCSTAFVLFGGMAALPFGWKTPDPTGHRPVLLGHCLPVRRSSGARAVPLFQPGLGGDLRIPILRRCTTARYDHRGERGHRQWLVHFVARDAAETPQSILRFGWAPE